MASGARTNELEKRAGYANARDFYAITDPKVAPQFIVPQTDVMDLTGKMGPDGTSNWTPPAGEWMVLRIGYFAYRPRKRPRAGRGYRPGSG